jgi:hypothetical protein
MRLDGIFAGVGMMRFGKHLETLLEPTRSDSSETQADVVPRGVFSRGRYSHGRPRPSPRPALRYAGQGKRDPLLFGNLEERPI